MAPVITDADLRRETPDAIETRIADLRTSGHTPRQVLTELTVAALHAAQDAAHRLSTYLADGWNGDPAQLPADGPGPQLRDRMLLAAMVAADNAARLAGAARTHQHIDRPTGFDPLTDHHPAPQRVG